MSSTQQKLIAASAIASAVVLSADAAEAWGGTYYGGARAYRPAYAFAYRPYAANFTYRPPYAYRSYYGYQPFYAYRPYVRAAYASLYGAGYDTYSYYPYSARTGYFGSGTFSDGRRVPGTNYNPNQ